jgi:hypothetical protein
MNALLGGSSPIFPFGHPPAFQPAVNAIAITANDPLGMLGGAPPLRGARGTAFDNLLNAFELASPVAKTAAVATSKQIASAMIATMLGVHVSTPAVNIVDAPPAESESGDTAASQETAQNMWPQTQSYAETAQQSTSSDGSLRPMAAFARPAMDDTPEASMPPEIPDVTAALKETGTSVAPALETSDMTSLTVPKVSQRHGSSGSPPAPATPATTVQLEAGNIAQPVPAIATQAPGMMARPEGPKSEASSPGNSNGTRALTVTIANAADVTVEIPRRQTGDAATVARTVESVKDPTAPAPLAFSADLTPISDGLAANRVMTVASVDSPQPSQPSPTQTLVLPPSLPQAATSQPDISQPGIPQPAAAQPDPSQPDISRPAVPPPDAPQPTVSQSTVSQPAVPLPTVSQLAGSQPNSIEAGASAGEDVKPRTVAPEHRESGNEHSDRSPQRDAQDNSKNETPAGVTQASVAVSGSPTGWTMSATPAAVTNAAEIAGPAVQTVRAAPAADPTPQPIATNSWPSMVQSPAVQEIAVRISAPDSPVVDLHVTERGGEIHVAVRTPDVELQTSLRQDLGTLAGSLERTGYHAETFVPRAGAGAQMNSREERPGTQPGFSGRGGSQGESGNGRQKGRQEQRGASWLEEQEQST